MNNDQHQINLLARKYDMEMREESNRANVWAAEILLGIVGAGVFVGIIALLWLLKEAV